MLVRTITIVTLLLFSAHFPVFSQEILRGNALSASTSTTLTKNGFSPLSQELSQTGQDDFADNITLSFARNEDIPTEAENGRNEVIFCFTQEDFASHQAEILDFLSFLMDLKRSWTATVLFSALDNPEFPDIHSIKGTRVFAESVDDTDSVAAIAISLDSSHETAIHTGSRSHTLRSGLRNESAMPFSTRRQDFPSTTCSRRFTVSALFAVRNGSHSSS